MADDTRKAFDKWCDENNLVDTSNLIWMAWQASEAHMQSKIDTLMFEYCPDEMTEEQIKNWEKCQQSAIDEVVIAEPAAWLVDGNVEQSLFWTKEDADNAAGMNCGTVLPLYKSHQTLIYSKRIAALEAALIDALDDVGAVLQDYEGALPYKKERYAAQKATYENIKRLIAINSTDTGEG